MPTYKNPMGASAASDDSSPSTGLTRSYTRSSKHELLKQIRDAVNPNQRLHNGILMAQATLYVFAPRSQALPHSRRRLRAPLPHSSSSSSFRLLLISFPPLVRMRC